MPYSKQFQAALDDAIARARWRVEVHQQDMLPTEKEKDPATVGDLSKALIVTYDLVEKFINDVLAALADEDTRRNGASRAGSKLKAKPKSLARRKRRS
jgi:hypothetical protein